MTRLDHDECAHCLDTVNYPHGLNMTRGFGYVHIDCFRLWREWRKNRKRTTPTS